MDMSSLDRGFVYVLAEYEDLFLYLKSCGRCLLYCDLCGAYKYVKGDI